MTPVQATIIHILPNPGITRELLLYLSFKVELSTNDLRDISLLFSKPILTEKPRLQNH